MLALTTKLSWYIARSSGLIAWALVTFTVIWGLALSSRLIRKRGVPAWLLSLHRYLATLTVVFVAVHILALVADNYVYYGWKELFVPLAVRTRPGPTAWGIAAFYVLVAIQITSWLMKRLPRRLWHAIHLSSFGLYGAATVHALQGGTDTSNRFVQLAAFAGLAVVAGLVFFRVLTRSNQSQRRPATAPAVDGAAAVRQERAAAS